MWHEARKQEKFIKNVMVDVKKRAERRKDFYEKIKLDPIRFLRLYGTKSKINIDPEIAMAAENPNTLMTWTGDNKTIIDRFDGRANLDGFSIKSDYVGDREEKLHERMCNYERYRCLVHNQFAKINEVSALNRIELAEKYGEDVHKFEKKQIKKKPAEKATIGYVYSDTDYIHKHSESENESDSQDSEPDLEMDLDIEINVNHLHFVQQKELVKMSQQYGLRGNDYLKLMKLDKTQEENLRTAKILEEQKAQFHGRKSRRERKIFKEQRLRERYMKQDPRTLSFGASSFHEEIYEGKNLLTPSPKRASRSLSPSPTVPSVKVPDESSRNLKDFLKLPKKREQSGSHSRSRSRSRSRGNRGSNSPVFGPRLPFCSVKASNKKSSYRDKMENRDKRRKETTSYSRSPIEHSSKPKNDRLGGGRSRLSDRTQQPSHNYHLSKSRSPELQEDEILKKKYYLSDPEDKSSSSSDSSESRSKSKSKCADDQSNADGSQKFSDDNSRFKKAPRIAPVPNQYSNQGVSGTAVSSFHGGPGGNKLFNPKDLLKRQMEIQLNRAYRADKKAEQEKQQKVEKERSDREYQLREMAFQIRKRERERRRRERKKSSRSRSTSSTASEKKRSRSPRDRRGRDIQRSSRNRRSSSRSHHRSRSIDNNNGGSGGTINNKNARYHYR